MFGILIRYFKLKLMQAINIGTRKQKFRKSCLPLFLQLIALRWVRWGCSCLSKWGEVLGVDVRDGDLGGNYCYACLYGHD